MRSILENAVIHHLNGDSEKAAELFHDFVVARARQIHESMRNGEDCEFDEETVSETYFGEDDLAEVEDDVDPAEEVSDDLGVDDADMGAEDEMGDDLGDTDFDAEMEDDADMGDDMGEDMDFEERLEDLQAELERLTAEFEELNDVDSDEDMDGEADLGDDMGDEDMGDDFADDEEEFKGLGESTTSELEKITVSLVDGKEVGAGSSITQQRKSPIPQKAIAARQGGTPVSVKGTQHKGFERETAPSVTDMKKRRNTMVKSKDALSNVAAPKAAEGKEVGAAGKTSAVNKKSPVVRK